MESFLKEVEHAVDTRIKNSRCDAYVDLPDKWESPEMLKEAVLNVRELFADKPYIVRLYSLGRIQITMMGCPTTNTWEYFERCGAIIDIDQQLAFFDSISETPEE
jgi:hypothetical protein